MSPRRMYNWTFKDIVKILKKNKFKHVHTHGSHFYYVRKEKSKVNQVCVPFHGSSAIKPRTLKGIIEQSGLPKKVWLQ